MAYLLIGYLQAPETLQLTATRRLSIERAVPDQEVEVTVTVTNHGPGLEEVLLSDRVPPRLTVRLKASRHLVRLERGEAFTFRYTVSGPRGGYAFDGLEAQVNDPLGIRSAKFRVEAKARLFVFPPVTRLRHIAIRPRQTRVYSGVIPAHQGGSGIEFYGLREYQMGDSPHHINWRVSARQGDVLYSNEL